MVTSISIIKNDGTESSYPRCYARVSPMHFVFVRSCDDNTIIDEIEPARWLRVNVSQWSTNRQLAQHQNPTAPSVPQWMKDAMTANGWGL